MAAPAPLLFLLLLFLGLSPPAAPRGGSPAAEELLVLTVATELTDGYERFLRSARAFNYSTQTLGLGRRWRGGDVARAPGGGQKVRWLRAALEPLRDRDRLVVLFVDSYDVVFAGGPRELLGKFLAAGAAVLFAAEAFCWPQGGLAPAYPPAPPGGKPFLNSGGFVGFAPAVWRLVQRWRYRDDDDDQLFYTRLFLDPRLREELPLALDHHSRIFQNLNGAIDEVVLKFAPGGVRVRNVRYDSLPVVLHGNGPTKLQLNYLGNYVPGGWSHEGDCGHCDPPPAPRGGDTAPPVVLVGVFVEAPTPFFRLFLRRLLRLRHPPARLRLFLHNREVSHEADVAEVWPLLSRHFGSARAVGPEEGLEPGEARDMGMDLCRRDPQCDYYLSLDSDVALTHPGVLSTLLGHNRRIVAPLLSRPGQLWSNFWGALSPDGYYARSQDYVDIVQGKRRGVWNVPYVSHAYLVGGATLRRALGAGPVFSHPDEPDPDMAFCRHARDAGVFLHVSNRRPWGHLLVSSGFNASRRRPDLWEQPRNPSDWEEQYLHPNYSRIFQDKLYQEPCPDVYQFPLFSERFCQDLLDEAEGYGHWSDDHHEEGAESLPLARLGLEGAWLEALGQYLAPVAARLFPGYQHKGRAALSAVIRYRPGPAPGPAPPARRPPPATVTLSVSLGPPRGGGWRFPRYACGAPAPPPGWALLHPGRLTHLPWGVPPPPGPPRLALLTLLDP